MRTDSEVVYLFIKFSHLHVDCYLHSSLQCRILYFVICGNLLILNTIEKDMMNFWIKCHQTESVLFSLLMNKATSTHACNISTWKSCVIHFLHVYPLLPYMFGATEAKENLAQISHVWWGYLPTWKAKMHMVELYIITLGHKSTLHWFSRTLNGIIWTELQPTA